MRIGIFSDIHGNMPALRHCLQRLEMLGVDRLVCLGDIFGYFPDGAACLDLLIDREATLLMGNHEAFLIGAAFYGEDRAEVYGYSQSSQPLSRKHHRIIQNLSPIKTLDYEGQSLLFVHGSPWDPLNGYVYPDTTGPLPFVDKTDVIFMGHTHRPYLWEQGEKQAVNVGACGLPRDNGTYASFCIYDTTSRRIEPYRSDIDIDNILAHYKNVHPQVKKTLARKERLNPAWRII